MFKKGRRFSDWVKLFESKSGEPFYLPPGYKLWAGPDNSFISYKIDEDTFYVGQAVGNGGVWWHFILAIAREKGCKHIVTQTFRSPRAFCRKWGAKVIDTQEVYGRPCYTLQTEVR